jgi:mannose-6-phosphate isomerase-like protein (cupin superfamily)
MKLQGLVKIMDEYYTCPYYVNTPMHIPYNMCTTCKKYACPYHMNAPMYNDQFKMRYNTPYNPYQDNYDYETECGYIELTKDYGPEPFVINIEDATIKNNTFRTAIWTGDHLQLTLMSIDVGDEIGLEIHPDIDQFIRIEEGYGIVLMGEDRVNLDFQEMVHDGYAFIIPAGTWHNLINLGDTPIKLYSIYAPPKHPWGTVQETREDAMADKCKD